MGEFADRFIRPGPFDTDGQVLHTILKWAVFSFAIMAVAISTGLWNFIIYEAVMVALVVLVLRKVAGIYHDREDADKEYFRQYGNSNTLRRYQEAVQSD